MENDKIIRAESDDHHVLTDITNKSKAYWGYSDQQMDEWSDLLTITKDYIESNEVYKLLVEDLPIGYYSYFNVEKNTVKLDNLFVLPEHIGKGFGKFLMNDFLKKIGKTERKRIILDADPNAEQFYESFGFIKTGEIETSIKDRILPIMEKKL